MMIEGKNLLSIITVIFMCISVACTTFDIPEQTVPTAETDTPIRELSTPIRNYWYIAWFPNGNLVVMGEDAQGEAQNFIATDEGLWVIELEQDPRCEKRLRYEVPTVLPDGRLGLLKDCIVNWPAVKEGDSLDFMMAYDWDTGMLEPIVSEPLPDLGGGIFSWNPEMTQGVQAGGSLLGTIFWIMPEGAGPMEITLSNDSKTWSLAQNYWAMLARDSDSTPLGIARAPAWSPDGKTIAFFASLDAVGRSGQSRAEGEYMLYLMDPDTLQPEPVLDGIYYAHRLVWSPDGQWLAFIAHRENNKGMWLYAPESGELRVVTYDSLGGIAWSPDGQEIAAIRCDEYCQQDELVVYNVSELIQIP